MISLKFYVDLFIKHLLQNGCLYNNSPLVYLPFLSTCSRVNFFIHYYADFRKKCMTTGNTFLDHLEQL